MFGVNNFRSVEAIPKGERPGSKRLQPEAASSYRQGVDWLKECQRPSKGVFHLLALSICLVSSGCFPYYYTTRPGLKGTLISADNGEPVVGAVISFAMPGATHVGDTTVNGCFSVRPQKRWGIWIIPQDVFSRRYNLLIRHDAFKTYEAEIFSNPSQLGTRATKKLGIIPMERLEPGSER
jgi:hypothetical protein